MATTITFPSILNGMHRAVGCVDLMHRNLMVRLFYPTDTKKSQEFAKWLPSKEYAEGFIAMAEKIMPSPLPPIDTLMNTVIQTTSKTPLIRSSSRYPVAVLSHGLGGNRCLYSATSIGLASRGYVVANVEHRDESASTSLRRVPGPGVNKGEFEKYVNDWIPFNTNCANGRFEKNVSLRRKQVKIRRKDVSDALDILISLNAGEPMDNMTLEEFDYGQFKNQLDIDKCFVIGHSFGGATVIHTLYEDKRFRCGVALDPNLIPVHDEVYCKGFDQPLLFINSELGYQWEDNINNLKKLLKPDNEQVAVTTTPVLTIRNTTHFGFTDYSHVIPGYNGQLLDKDVCTELVIDLSDAFVRRFLMKDELSDDEVVKQVVPDLHGGEKLSENLIPGTVISIPQ